jgi:formate dehydrogenase major subunit
MEKVRFNLDGAACECAAGSTLLEAIRNEGIEIPALCDDARLKPCGSCRLCLVEVRGWDRPVASCLTAAKEGMVVRTNTPELEAGRRAILSMLAARYPADAAREFPDKPFHRWLRHYGISAEGAHAGGTDGSHPYIQVDMQRCIYCYRCVRICAEVQGQFVWHIWNRGDATRIVADTDTPLGQSTCVACGACVDTCPTGALEDKQLLRNRAPSSWTRTTCPYCGTGCEMDVGTSDGQLVSVRPVLDAPVNRGHLCVKGRYAFGFVHAADRITHPMIRRNGRWAAVSWSEAISYVAERLARIRERDGPDSIGVLGSARATNEENYIIQKFARVVLRTNNVDCCARVCHAPTAAAMGMMLGAGAATNSYNDIEAARTILVVGANATDNHPIVGARIKQAALRGARLITIDPRRTELAEYAALHLPLRPGTNVALLNAMACAVVEENRVDSDFIASRVDGWDDYREFIRAWTPERAEAICGVGAELIREAARLYAARKPSLSVHGLGLTEHAQGTEGVMCLVNLALITGNIGKPGTGVNPLRGQNNVQGSAHMGCEPDHLTGYVTLDSGRAAFESAWGSPLPVSRGKNLIQMMDAAERRELHALWAAGYDILLTNPNARATVRALSNLDLVIVQDMFLNETARAFGAVFLPACSSFEKDGTFMNAERRVQRVRRAIEPLGESRTDWEIVCAVAQALGHAQEFSYSSAEEIWNEVRSVWRGAAGMSFARLDRQGLQWPCPSEDHPGTQILHAANFPHGQRAALRCAHWRPSGESASLEYPILLTTGRLLYQFNAGTMTMRTENVYWREIDTLDLSPEDARKLNIASGDRVRVASRHGSTDLPARVLDSIRPGEAFATFTSPDVFLNRITGPDRDETTDTPQYKVTAVRVEKVV